MGASDYMVGNAPAGASYMAPQVGAQLGQTIAGYPQAYMQGVERQRELAMMNAFPNGIPMTPDGQPDTNAINQTLTKIGGGGYVQQLMPYLYGQQAQQGMANLDRAASGAGAFPASTGPTTGASGTSPQNLGQRTPAGPAVSDTALGGGAGTSPPLSSTGASDAGQDTIRSVATEMAGGKDALSAIGTTARSLHLNPDAPLNPQQAAQVRQFLGNAVGFGQNATRVAGNDDGKPQPNSTQAPPTQGANGGGGEANGPGANTPIKAQSSVRDDTSIGPDPALMQQVNRLRQAAGIARNYSMTPGLDPVRAKAASEAAAAYEARANQLFDFVAKGEQAAYGSQLKQEEQAQEHGLKNQDLTNEEKIARANRQPTPQASATRAKEIEGEVVQSQKTYNGIQGQASQYQRDLKPNYDLLAGVLSRPDMYSGIGSHYALDFNRVKAAFGDRNAAVLQEAVSKLTATSVLSQINTQRDQLMEAGGTSARIFSQQVDLVEKAAPGLANTPAGNRFLVHVAQRMGEVSMTVAQHARDYIKTHGHLDAGFDQEMSEYLTKHPVFNKMETEHPEYMAAPDAPSNIRTKQEAAAWRAQMGIKPGDPYRLPSGEIRFGH